MKKALLILSSISILVLAGIVAVFHFYLPGLVKEKGQVILTEVLGHPATIKSVTLELFPIQATLTELNGSHDLATFQVPTVKVKLKLLSSLFSFSQIKTKVDVLVQNPELRIKPIPPAKTPPRKESKPASPQISLPQGIDSAIQFKLENGLIQTTQALPGQPGAGASVTIRNLNFSINTDSLYQKISQKMTSQIHLNSPFYNMAAPISMTSELQMDWQKQVAFLNSNAITFAGLLIQSKGWYSLPSGHQSWATSINIPDMRKIKLPQGLPLKGQVSGGILVNANYFTTKTGVPAFKGKVHIKQLKAFANLKEKQLQVAGPIFINSNVQFSGQGEIVSIPVLNSDVNLDHTQILFGQFLNKPQKIPFGVKTQASFKKNRLSVSSSEFRFAQFKTMAQGILDLNPKKSSSFKVAVPNTSLAGFEKFIPLAAKQPVSGQVQLNATITGDIQNPMDMSLNIRPLKLKNVRTYLSWTSPDKAQKISGPIALNTQVQVSTHGQNLNSALLNVNADLSKLNLKIKGLFNKTNKMPLNIQMQGAAKGMSFNLKRMLMSSYFGNMQTSGTFSQPQKPKFNLRVTLKNFDLKRLSQSIPLIQPFDLNGRVNSQLTARGQFDLKGGIEKSPITVNGSTDIKLPQFSYTPPESQDTEEAKKPLPPPKPLAPNWPVVRNSQLRTTVTIGKVKYGDLQLGPIKSRMNVVKGIASGTASVQNLFSGQAHLQKLRVPLLQSKPKIQSTASVKNINLNAALSWLSKDFANVIKGYATGTVKVKTTMPNVPNFIEKTRSRGKLKVSKVVIDSLPVANLVTKELAKIPQAKGQKAPNAGKTVQANLKTDFAFDGKKANLNSFDLKLADNNQLTAKGWVGLDKKIRLDGTAYTPFKNPKGDFIQCNLDKTGRLVVPVEIKGYINKPSLAIATATINKMKNKTISCVKKREIKKAKAKVKKAKKKAKKQAKKSLDKKKKGLEKQIKKGLGDLFK